MTDQDTLIDKWKAEEGEPIKIVKPDGRQYLIYDGGRTVEINNDEDQG